MAAYDLPSADRKLRQQILVSRTKGIDKDQEADHPITKGYSLPKEKSESEAEKERQSPRAAALQLSSQTQPE